MLGRKRIVIVGATSTIAEHCARRWVRDREVDLVLVGRDPARMQRVQADLQVRSPGSRVEALQTSFVDPAAIQACVDSIAGDGAPDVVLIAHGFLPEQAACQSDVERVRDALEVNGISPLLFAEAFAPRFENENRGTLAIIGSVAGDRGRKSNYVYGAAKGALERYAQGLQHRFAGTGVRVVLIKPGPTATPMTASLALRGLKLAPVEQVARDIVLAIERGRVVAYTPPRWRLIMWVIRHLPAAIFNRLRI